MRCFSKWSMLILLVLVSGQLAFALPNISGPYGDPVNPGGSTGPYYKYIYKRISDGVITYNWFDPVTDPTWNAEHTFVGTERFVDTFLGGPILPFNTTGRAFHISDDQQALDLGFVDITTFFGIKASGYLGDIGPITGFDPNSTPAITDKAYIGASGTLYQSQSHQLITLGELLTTYTDFDLSQWVGDPSSMVHVFVTNMPKSDVFRVLVPEPTSLALIGATLLFFGGHRSRATRIVK